MRNYHICDPHTHTQKKQTTHEAYGGTKHMFSELIWLLAGLLRGVKVRKDNLSELSDSKGWAIGKISSWLSLLGLSDPWSTESGTSQVCWNAPIAIVLPWISQNPGQFHFLCFVCSIWQVFKIELLFLNECMTCVFNLNKLLLKDMEYKSFLLLWYLFTKCSAVTSCVPFLVLQCICLIIHFAYQIFNHLFKKSR